MKKYLLIIFISIISFSSANATHIKAGDISAKIIDPNFPNDYTFTLTIYYETTRVTGSGAVNVDNQTMTFGDGGSLTSNLNGSLVNIGNGTSTGTYIFKHSYASVGTYKVGFRETNRIIDIKNMSESVYTAFFVDAQIIISPFIPNNSAILLNYPIDIAYTGKVFKHNPGAYDPDGDSLSFELIPPKKSGNTDVDGYLSPADPIFGGISNSGGASYISIDPFTGEVTWDTPGAQGIYNIAIRITDWRNGVKLGFVVRDMQITVKDGKNNPPKIVALKDTCIEAGSSLIQSLNVSDPDKNDIIVTGIGEAFLNSINSPIWANFTPQTRKTSPSVSTLTLNTNCSLIRTQPYLFTFKAEDQPPFYDKLTDFYTWKVKIVAPKVKNFTAQLQNNNEAKLQWTPYNITDCNARNANNKIKYQIIRTRCDSLIIDNKCPELGLPNAELIATLNLKDSIYIDKNNGKGLSQSTNYYYSIRVIFTDVLGGISNWAPVQKITPLINAPLIKSITSLENKIEVEWKAPLDTSIFQGNNYTLSLITKAKGTNNTKTQSISTNNLLGGKLTFNAKPDDTLYVIKLTLSDSFGHTFTSNEFSNLLLSTSTQKSELQLTWNQHQPINTAMYQVYNPISGELLNTLNTVNDTLQKFSLSNLPNCDTSCAFVKAIAYYCVGALKDTVVFTSNKGCDLIRGGTTPTLNLKLLPNICSNYSCEKPFPAAPYSNSIYWDKPSVPICDYPANFDVYYSETDSYDWNLIGKTKDTFYVHGSLSNFSGCYMVKSANSFGDEGPMSNIVCQDICPCYELPNIISPNGDDKNELFVPLPDPRFVESVKFKVYNRWGQVVYELEDNNQILIKWDAKNLSDGIYFYQADVTYARRAKNADRYQTLKGWVQIVK